MRARRDIVGSSLNRIQKTKLLHKKEDLVAWTEQTVAMYEGARNSSFALEQCISAITSQHDDESSCGRVTARVLPCRHQHIPWQPPARNSLLHALDYG